MYVNPDLKCVSSVYCRPLQRIKTNYFKVHNDYRQENVNKVGY